MTHDFVLDREQRTEKKNHRHLNDFGLNGGPALDMIFGDSISLDIYLYMYF